MLGFSPLSAVPLGDDIVEQSGSGNTALYAVAVATGVPSVESAQFAQGHVVGAAPVAGQVPVVASASLQQDHDLNADAVVTGTPQVSGPSLTLSWVLVANNIAAGPPTVATANFEQAHGVASAGIVTAAPVVQAANFSQNNQILFSNIATAVPVVGSTSILHTVEKSTDTSAAITITVTARVSVAMTTDTAAPVTIVVSPADVVFELPAQGIVGSAPIVSAATLGITNSALTADNIAAGVPNVGYADFSANRPLQADDITGAVPIVGTTALTQQALVSTNTAAPVTITVDAGLIFRFTVNTAAPVEIIVYVLVVFPDDIAAGTPTLDAAEIYQDHSLTLDGVTTTPVIPQIVFRQHHLLSSVDDVATSQPTVDAVVFRQNHPFNTGAVVTGTPTVDAADFTESHDLDVDGIVAGVPAIPASIEFAQAHILQSANIATDVPSIPAAEFTQDHGLISEGISTGLPTLGQPDTIIRGNYPLAAVEITGSEVVIPAVAITEITSLSQVINLPAFATAASAQVIYFSAITGTPFPTFAGGFVAGSAAEQTSGGLSAIGTTFDGFPSPYEITSGSFGPS